MHKRRWLFFMDYHKNVPCRIMHFPFFFGCLRLLCCIHDMNYYFWNCSYQIFDPSWKKSVKVSALGRPSKKKLQILRHCLNDGGRGPAESQFEKKFNWDIKWKGRGGLAKFEMSHLSTFKILENMYQIFIKNFHKFCLKNVNLRGGTIELFG